MKLQGKVWKYGDNIDTDVIIPARYLVTTDPQALAAHCMEDIDAAFAGGVQPGDIIVGGTNFGCGSSREHAVWGLENYGFRVILAPSFADIFYNNCFNNGVAPLILPGEAIERLFAEVRGNAGYRLTVDLPRQVIVKPDGSQIAFEIDPFRKHCLLAGLDQIGLTLLHEKQIAAFERANGIA